MRKTGYRNCLAAVAAVSMFVTAGCGLAALSGTAANTGSDPLVAVAAFFEAHGVSPSALLVAGHGATDLVAPGPSAANRRVVVVIDEP